MVQKLIDEVTKIATRAAPGGFSCTRLKCPGISVLVCWAAIAVFHTVAKFALLCVCNGIFRKFAVCFQHQSRTVVVLSMTRS